MDENKPPYYCIFYKTWRPKPSEEQKRPLKSRDNLGKRIKLSVCNWDNLPNELKMMCIERTDFKTRANLMLSNRHNKMLVESIKSKYQLSYVHFSAIATKNNGTFKFAVKSWRSKPDYTSRKFELKKLKLLLQNAKIENLDVQISGKNPEMYAEKLAVDLENNYQKFTVKSLKIVLKLSNHLEFTILRNCDEHLEHISLIVNNTCYVHCFRNFLNFPQVLAAKRLTLCQKRSETSRDLFRLKLEAVFIDWLLFDEHVDHNIGKEVIIERAQWWWEEFLRKVSANIEFRHPTEKMLCLRLQNPEKQMWAWLAEPNGSLNFLVSAVGSDAPNIEEIQKQRAKERKEYMWRTRR